MISLLFLIHLIFYSNGVRSLQCNQVLNTPNAQFFRIKQCYQSDMQVSFYGFQHTVDKCIDYAIQKRGLALNFLAKSSNDEKNRSEPSCHVLDCPEFSNSSSVFNNTEYDYYSLYADPIPSYNYTCLPNIGLFRFNSKRLNYTMALAGCQEENGDLAHILSEMRTNAISDFLSQTIQMGNKRKKIAYVGLDNMKNQNSFQTPLDEPLNCFSYRAWAPANPKIKAKQVLQNQCVVIDGNRMWRTVNCGKKLPSICELYPAGPLNSDYDYINDECERN